MKSNFVLWLILAAAAVLFLTGINKPFIGHHDWNGAFWGGLSRDYLRFFSGESPKLYYFSHYTPMLPAMFTVAIAALGSHEYSLRLVTVVFSLLLLWAIYQIGTKLYSKSVGMLAVMLTAVTPMFQYFGKLPDHEPIITSLIALTFYAYLRLDDGRTWNYRFLALSAVTFMESWSGYFLLPFLFIHRKYASKGRLGLLVLAAVIGLSVVVGHVLLVEKLGEVDGVNNFIKTGILRTNLKSAGGIHQFTWKQFLETEARYTVIYFTRILTALSIVWLGRLAWLVWKRKQHTSDSALVVLCLYGGMFIFTFRNLSYIHDYKLYLLLPFITIASSVVIWDVLKLCKPHTTVKSAWLVAIGVVILVAAERWEYLRTLQKTSFNLPGYQLGMVIGRLTDKDQAVIVNSKEFEEYFGIFVRYYSDRQVAYEDLTLDRFMENAVGYHQEYRYLVLVDNRTRDPNLEAFLRDNYEVSVDSDEGFAFVDLTNHKLMETK